MKTNTKPKDNHPKRQLRATLRRMMRESAAGTIEPNDTHAMAHNGTAIKRKAGRTWRETDPTTLEQMEN